MKKSLGCIRWSVLTLLAAVASAAVLTSYAEPTATESSNWVWPLSASSTPDYPLNATFGPRLLAAQDDRYDFHRGLDMATKFGTSVHAVAKGVVFRAGEYPQYADRVVVLRHDLDGERLYSFYSHLDAVRVKEGDKVEQGQVVAESGRSASGFAHLHFEMRHGKNYQKNAFHPLRYLPYPDDGGPEVVFVPEEKQALGTGPYRVSVTLPPAQLDLVSVSVAMIDVDTGAELGRQTYDMEDWNQKHTTEELDQHGLGGVKIEPVKFSRREPVYQIDLSFFELVATGSTEAQIRVEATDARGNTTTLEPHLEAATDR